MSQQVIDNSTGKSYSLEHLAPFEVTYEIRVKEEPVNVTLNVHFSDHCYTRSREEEDPDNAVVQPAPGARPGEERVFCIKRWNFSQKLPGIIRNLHSKGCLVGGSKELFYRLEDPQSAGSVIGWYLCIRLSASDKFKDLTLSVRSVHHRHNRPVDTRGSSKRFYAILQQFYEQEKAKRKWLK